MLSLVFISTKSSLVIAEPLTEEELSVAAVSDHAAALQWIMPDIATGLAAAQFQSQFSTNVYGQADYSKSHHTPLSPTSPVFTPVKNIVVGMRKKISHGISTDIYAYSGQRSTAGGALSDATQTGLKAQIDFDLNKNFLGKSDSKILSSFKHNMKANSLKSYIESKKYEFAVRKLYWAIVANRESLKVAKRIEQLAKKQWKESLKRKKLSLSDEGEVSRYVSQYYKRKSAIAIIEYQNEKLVLALKKMVPSLEGRTIDVSSVDLNKTTILANQCIATINSLKEVPWDLTKMHNYLEELEQFYSDKSAEYKNYNKADIKLFGNIDYAGKDTSYSDSIGELVKDGKAAYQVGLSFNMPLGKSFDETKKKLILKDKIDFDSIKMSIYAEVKSRHEQMLKFIPILLNTMKVQNESSAVLKKTIEISSEKYNQARVSVDQVVGDQNAWVTSLMEQIDTQLIVIQSIYDYLSVFTETPCEINKLTQN